MSQPSVAIILINWNSFKYTNDCLNSLSEIDYENKRVIVVDNNSNDTSLRELKAIHQWVDYVENDDNLGFTGGNNEGIKYALDKGIDYLLLLNNDTLVESNFLSELIPFFQDPSIGAVQPKIFYEHDRQLIWNAGGRFNKVFMISPTIGLDKRDSEVYNNDMSVDWITGCAFLVRADVVEKIGLTSDVYFYGCYDDVDWSLRIKKAGYKLWYCPKSVVYHAVGMAMKSDEPSKEGVLKPFFHYLANRNHIFFVRRHVKPLFWFTAYAYQVVKFFGYSGYFLYKKRYRKLKAFIHGFFHGITKPMNPEALRHKYYINKYR